MLFSRKALGIEISPQGVALALLGGTQTAPRLERVAFRPVAPGTLRVSLKEHNILDPQALSDRLREAHALLLHRGSRASITLPDVVGRVLMMDVEGRFKSRSEALDVIRWKLKKSMPFDVADAHLDYQMLQVRDNGDMALLVALVSRTVITQYEEVIGAAGLVPAGIDLNVFSLCRAFDQRMSLLENLFLISFYENILTIVAFRDGSPEFVRIKELRGTSAVDNRAYTEINNSLLVYRERFAGHDLQHVACIAEPAVAGEFRAMVNEATGIEAVLLEIKAAVKPSDAAPADQESLYPFSAAIGAALRSL